MRSRHILTGICLAAIATCAVAETRLYFGDLHLHTRYSNDAFAFFGTTRTPDDAYRYARGEPIETNDGRTVRISQPLDFLAVTDHMRYPGALQSIAEPDSPYGDTEVGKLIRSTDRADHFRAFLEVLKPARTGAPPAEGLDDKPRSLHIWRLMVESADKHYEPGKFTTFAAYEWTSEVQRLPDRPYGNMHRNVIFADTRDLPYPLSSLDTTHPEELWKYLEAQRMRGVDVLAIPHNANISDGLMFAPTDSWGAPVDEHYAARRTWNEPLVEVTQQKGTSETHPGLSPTDEFASFELYRNLFGSNIEGQLGGSYIRDAYKRGIEYQSWGFFNPFMFGLVGATDTHAGLSTVSENRLLEDVEPASQRVSRAPSSMVTSAGGLTGVWAEANRRDTLFSALRRRETFATTGPRISVRFFGGWNYTEELFVDSDWVQAAYAGGVPMGGVLEDGSPGVVPKFAVYAAKDPNGANLDRVQIIKGWVVDGASHEQIFDVALSDGRAVGADGSVPSVGNSVDPVTATWGNDIGAATLFTLWEDPYFDPRLPAFYYVRVIEIPTPRWQTYDAVASGTPLPEGVAVSIQERAFTSPIWYQTRRPR